MKLSIFNKILNKMSLINFDLIFTDLNRNNEIIINTINEYQKSNHFYFIPMVYIIENLNFLEEEIQLNTFDYLLKPLCSQDILKKINFYKNNRIDENFENYKMSIKGRLIKTLEHQWKQPLNYISTNILNLGIKSELNKLKTSDIESISNNIESSLNQISQTMSNFNYCFDSSNMKSIFCAKDAFLCILEFILPKAKKNNINLNTLSFLDEIQIVNYKNDFSLTIMLLINIFIEFAISNKDSENKTIIISSENNNGYITFSINCHKELMNSSILNNFNLELFVIKNLLRKMEVNYKIFTKNNHRFLELLL